MAVAIQADKEQIKVLYVQGLSLTTLAKKFNISPNTIGNWVKRGNWTDLRNRTEQDLNKAVLVAVNKQVNKAEQSRSETIRVKLMDELEVNLDALGKTKPKARLEHLSPRSRTLTSLVDAASKVFGWSEQITQSNTLVLLSLEPSQAAQQGLVRAIDVESSPAPEQASTVQPSTEQASPAQPSPELPQP